MAIVNLGFCLNSHNATYSGACVVCGGSLPRHLSEASRIIAVKELTLRPAMLELQIPGNSSIPERGVN